MTEGQLARIGYLRKFQTGELLQVLDIPAIVAPIAESSTSRASGNPLQSTTAISARQMRIDYIRRKFQTGELLNGFPLFYPATERPPPVDTIVNGRRTPTYMLCWKLVIDSDEVDDKYDCEASEIRRLFALPLWKERKYADQFGVEMLPRLQIVDSFLLILFGVNLSEEYMDSIMRPELVAAAREAYDIPDGLPTSHELKWRRMDP